MDRAAAESTAANAVQAMAEAAEKRRQAERQRAVVGPIELEAAERLLRRPTAGLDVLLELLGSAAGRLICMFCIMGSAAAVWGCWGLLFCIMMCCCATFAFLLLSRALFASFLAFVNPPCKIRSVYLWLWL